MKWAHGLAILEADDSVVVGPAACRLRIFARQAGFFFFFFFPLKTGWFGHGPFEGKCQVDIIIYHP